MHAIAQLYPPADLEAIHAASLACWTTRGCASLRAAGTFRRHGARWRGDVRLGRTWWAALHGPARSCFGPLPGENRLGSRRFPDPGPGYGPVHVGATAPGGGSSRTTPTSAAW